MRDREMTASTGLDELREFFTLADGEGCARTLGIDEARVRRRVRLLAQQVRAAETLARSQQPAEARALLARALDALAELAESHPAVGALVGPLRPLSAGAHEGGSLDDELTERETERFDDALCAARAALNRLEGLSLSPEDRRWIRARRAGLVVGALMAGALVYWQQSREVKLTPRASSFFGTAYVPANATDGYVASNWLLPDGTAGWLDVTFDRRKVTTIELVNVQGMSHYGTLETSIELYSGARRVRAFDLSLRASLGTPNPTRAALLAREPIDRIRINVRTYHDLGGGLAEVRVR
jgi:hypothetical protein